MNSDSHKEVSYTSIVIFAMLILFALCIIRGYRKDSEEIAKLKHENATLKDSLTKCIR